MQQCVRCVLTDAFPGVQIDENGLCSFCRRSTSRPQRRQQEEQYRKRFEQLLNRPHPPDRYHAVMAYSGGKDSSYTLARLSRDYPFLRVLAITLDNGFLSPQAKRNVAVVCRALNVDHIWVTPGEETLANAVLEAQTASVFPPAALQRASAICLTCISLIKSIVLRFAIDMEIPYLIYGWSSGQASLASSVLPVNPGFFRKTHAVTTAQLTRLMGPQAHLYLLRERHFEALERASAGTNGTSPFYFLHPLAFWDTSEAETIQYISELGWVKPTDTDPNSSNCLLNTYNIKQHLQRHGFHPYAFELAGMVRLGRMSRDEALQRLEKPADPQVLRAIEQRLERYR